MSNEKENENLYSPWETFRRKLKALFDGDEDITVGEIQECAAEDAQYALQVKVRGYAKYLALSQTLLRTKEFGNVTLRIDPDYADEQDETEYTASLYETIFKENPRLKDVRLVTDFTGSKHAYIRFQPEVIQFPNDDISDYNGNWSGLAQEIAREVFADSGAGTHFCTAGVDET